MANRVMNFILIQLIIRPGMMQKQHAKKGTIPVMLANWLALLIRKLYVPILLIIMTKRKSYTKRG